MILFECEALTLEEHGGGVALVKMTCAAEMNTLTYALLDGLRESLNILSNRKVRALIITGSGRAFCCGAHLDYFSRENLEGDAGFRLRDMYLSRIANTFDRLEQQPYPTIAAINGYALGGGCELALSCDFRIMVDSAKIGLPEVKLGAIAGAGGVQKLVRHIGRTKAIEWILLGSHIPAEEAERQGLLYALTTADQLLPEAFALTEELRRLSPRAIGQSKAAIYLSEDADLATARKFGLEALCMLIGSSDWNEGVAAFHAKRPPDFDGH